MYSNRGDHTNIDYCQIKALFQLYLGKMMTTNKQLFSRFQILMAP